MADLAVLILTFNEELHLERALRSVAPIAREIVVLDSGSTDRTVEIAERGGARVLTHPFVNQARQFQWGLDHAGLSAAWILRLDADEVIEPDLAAEIERRLPQLPADVTGVNLKRKHIFMGRWIRHGGRYPLTLLRLWRNGAAHVEDRWMDEHVVLTRGSQVTLDGGFADINLKDLTHFVSKHNDYATREAVEILIQRHSLRSVDPSANLGSQAALKRNIKERIYNRIPFQAAALGYFLYRYFFRLGVLDGTEGAIYHALQGGWYRFLVGAKVEEFQRQLASSDQPITLGMLAKLTGFPLETLRADDPAARAANSRTVALAAAHMERD